MAYYDDNGLGGQYDTGLDGYGSSGTGLGGYGSSGLDDDLGLSSGLGSLNLDSGVDYGGSGGLDSLDSGIGRDSGGLGGYGQSSLLDGNYSRDLLDSGLDNTLSFTDDLGYGNGLGASSLGGLGDSFDSYGGGLGSSGLGGLGTSLDDYGASLGGLGGVGLGTGSLGGFDDPNYNMNSIDSLGLSSRGLDGYGDGLGGLGSGLSGSLDGITSGLGGLGDSYGLDNLSGYGNDLGALGGWQSSWDTGLGGLGGDLLQDAAIGLGGAALGAAGASAYLGSRGIGSNLGYGTSGLGGYGSSYDGYYGNSMLDSNLGALGQSAFAGAYDGFYGTNNAALQYGDLASFESSLYANQAYNDIERDSIFRDRLAFDALDDAARMSAYGSYSPSMRSRLGLDNGYWGSVYGGGYSSFYDPAYSGWNSSSFGNLGMGSYGGIGYSNGYGSPSFYDNYLGNLSYSLPSSLRSYYGDYLGSNRTGSLPYWSDDSRFRELADLSYYQQRLQTDRALDSAERNARWQQRLGWEQLDAEQRRLRWTQMDELQRERLGLGLIGSWHGSRYAGSGQALSLPYELPSSLSTLYSPYIRGSASTGLFDPNYARYTDLASWSNALRYDRSLQDSERLRRWQQRLQWEQLNNADRQSRWAQMGVRDRDLLGLNSGYWGSQFSSLFDPSMLRPMQLPISSRLAAVFQPYQSKRTLLSSLRSGEDTALAFADLVAFENALIADRRLRTEDKLRRWKARVKFMELNEMERRRRFFNMQEAERRMLGLGVSSFFGRRYSAPLLFNGLQGLPPPIKAYPALRHQLPPTLQSRYGSYIAGPRLSTGPASRSLVGQDPARDLANRIRLSIAQKQEQLSGLPQNQRMAATDEKRRILAQMDADRNNNLSRQMGEDERLRRLGGY